MEVYLLEAQQDNYESPTLLGIFETKRKLVEVMKSLGVHNIGEVDGFYYADDETFYNVWKVPFNEYVGYGMQLEDDYEVTDINLNKGQ